jgi:hypothetical protein
MITNLLSFHSRPPLHAVNNKWTFDEIICRLRICSSVTRIFHFEHGPSHSGVEVMTDYIVNYETFRSLTTPEFPGRSHYSLLFLQVWIGKIM